MTLIHRAPGPAGEQRPLASVTRITDAPVAAPAAGTAPAPGRHRQNGMGDVVVPVENGEIVALPRLWDFELTEITPDRGVLRTDTGLIAVIALEGGTAVVTDVADAGPRRPA